MGGVGCVMLGNMRASVDRILSYKNGEDDSEWEFMEGSEMVTKKLLEKGEQLKETSIYEFNLNDTTIGLFNDIIRMAMTDSASEYHILYAEELGDEGLKKNFHAAKELLETLLTDTITFNQNTRRKYYIPMLLSLLIYSPSGSAGPTKHHVWIGYIHDVILRDLKKREGTEEERAQWVGVAIMLQAEYMGARRGEEFELGEFIMKYLTNILS
ncbi:unnamed protein product [Sphagnum balticum]